MDASINPKGILNFLSQEEIQQISDPHSGSFNELFQSCALAVLNTDSDSDSGKEMLEKFPDFRIDIVKKNHSTILEITNAPTKAFGLLS